MRTKIEIGMYCYDKTYRELGISKILSFESNNNVSIKYKNIIKKVSIGNLIASYDIIDLIEVGDVISFKEDIDNYKKTYVVGIYDLIFLDEIKDKILNENIRLIRILKYEQFIVNSYKVNEI